MAIPSTQVAAVVSPPGASATSIVQISSTHPVPVPRDGDLLIKLEYSGVCHSDLHSILGDTPMKTDVAGHEGVGTVFRGKYLFVRVEFEASIPIANFSNWYSWIRRR